MLTREQVLGRVQPIVKAAAKGTAVRDIMVKELSVSMTVLVPDQESQPVMEKALQAAIADLGAERVHVRFRPASEPASGAAEEASGRAASTGQSNEPVKGHGAGMEVHPLLGPDSTVEFVAVASGKGGVGKSTVTVNLAAALARLGQRVGIIDADIYGFSVPDMMGIEERPDIVDERVIPIERFGVKVISMGFFVEDNSPVVWRGPMLGKMLRNFFAEIEWGELDYMLLDLPPGTGDVALDIHQMIPQSKEIIVTTPHATAAFVAARAGAMALKTKHAILGVVENMSYYETKDGERDYVFGRGGGARLAETLHTDLLGQIPLGAPDNHPSEPDFSPSVYKEDSSTGQLYTQMAQQLIRKRSGSM
ncbi:Mrp/NBP35 family ATP-binding protein [Paenibacillus sp. IB182496]|uniref:Iron-sulfur cluster carrier protein n=1 Tax=Paenibacillus sabuli TaxID=2772509 RepID=A0A927BSM0_9BACL|nr:Mrp/NBP35 family ATP-binding protein [Paenibacillus sabuli]MBD2844688.1 Mrp/NBP35 family ATP-binding protein [Paenibacillus sabuli]